jgi:hypothetical protein
MYAALAAESESALSAALFDEDDVGRAYSLQKQFASPANFGNQRIRLDQERMHILGRAHWRANVAQLKVDPLAA